MENRIPTGRAAFRLGLGIAAGATLVLVWLSLGVGVIGADGDPDNRRYLRAAAIGLVGALVARFRPRGMATVTLALALAVAAIGGHAIAAGLGRPYSGPLELTLLNGFFASAFLVSAWLFGRAELRAAGAGLA